MKKKYFKHGDPNMGRFFNQKTWDMLTPAEQLIWEPQEGGWDNEKEFVQYRDNKKIRFFSERIWDIMPESEQDLWKPLKKDWPEISKEKESREERFKRMNANESKKGMDNLRLKPGMKIDLMGYAGEILAWGPRRHLMQFTKKGVDMPFKYGTLERLVEDSSWGTRDILKSNMNYSSFKTLQEAEAEYEMMNR